MAEKFPRLRLTAFKCTYNVSRGTWQKCAYKSVRIRERRGRTKSENSGVRPVFAVTWSQEIRLSDPPKSLIMLGGECG